MAALAKRPQDMTDDELKAALGLSTADPAQGATDPTAAPQKPEKFDPRTLSNDELQAIIEGDPDEHNRFWPSDTRSLKQWGQTGKKTLNLAGRGFDEVGKVGLEGVNGITEGTLRLAGLPFDLTNTAVQLLTNSEPPPSVGEDLVQAARKYGLSAAPDENDRWARFTRATGEVTGGGVEAGVALKSFATMLKAGKYVPEVVNMARTAWQRAMTEAANNPDVLAQETKAAAGAGVASGTLHALMQHVPWWADFMAQLSGGAAVSPRTPSRLSNAGREETVANTISELYSENGPADKVAGLRSAMDQGADALTNPDGSAKVPDFEPTTGQLAVQDRLLTNGDKVRVRPLSPYTKAVGSGTPELQTKLEGQSRAINAEADRAFNADPDKSLPYPVEPSDAGASIREDLTSKRAAKQQQVTKAYDQLNPDATRQANDLFDEAAKIKHSRTEADDPEDIPKEVTKFLDTFRERWPEDMKDPDTGAPLSFDDFTQMRSDALKSGDPHTLMKTEGILNQLAPEKSIGLLKLWRTKVMEKLKDAEGMLKNRLGNFRGKLEQGIDDFGTVDPNAPPGAQSEAAKFREASAQNKQLKQTYDEGPVGKTLETEYGRPVLPASDVPGQFVGAAKQPESWDALVAAAGDPSKATRAARRILQQRFQAATTNNPMTPESPRVPSSAKMADFLTNPDNRELLVHAYGMDHYNKLQDLTEAARLRESILTSPAVGGSNTTEKLKALSKLNAGQELDRLFSSLTLRLGFIARAGRVGTDMVYGKANEAMAKMYRDALIDPQYLKGLLDKTSTATAERARQRYRLYLGETPSKALTAAQPDDDQDKDTPPRYKAGGAVSVQDVIDANRGSASTVPAFAKGGPAIWYSALEKFLEEHVDDSLALPLNKWKEFLSGRPGVKKEELETVWPKLQDMVGPREAPIVKSDISDLLSHLNSMNGPQEFQTGNTLKVSDLPHEEVQSPLAMFQRYYRSTPDSPIQFELGDLHNGNEVIHTPELNTPGQPWSTSSPDAIRSMLDAYNANRDTKYDQYSRVRLPGGTDYKETILGSPLADPMDIDSAHFGSVPGVGKNQISWALHHSRFEPGLEGDFGATLPKEVQAAIAPAANPLDDIRHLANQPEVRAEEGLGNQRNQLPDLNNLAAARDRLHTTFHGADEGLRGGYTHPEQLEGVMQDADGLGDAFGPYPVADELRDAAQNYHNVRHGNEEALAQAAQAFEPEPEELNLEPDHIGVNFTPARIALAHEAWNNVHPNNRPDFGDYSNPFMNQEMDRAFYTEATARDHWINAVGAEPNDYATQAGRFLDHYAPEPQPGQGQLLDTGAHIDNLRQAWEATPQEERGGWHNVDNLMSHLDELPDDENVTPVHPNVPFGDQLSDAILDYRIGNAHTPPRPAGQGQLPYTGPDALANARSRMQEVWQATPEHMRPGHNFQDFQTLIHQNPHYPADLLHQPLADVARNYVDVMQAYPEQVENLFEHAPGPRGIGNNFTDEDVIQANIPHATQMNMTEAELRQQFADMPEQDRQYYRNEFARRNPTLTWQVGQGQGAPAQAPKALPAPAKPAGAKVTFIDELQSKRHQRDADRPTIYRGDYEAAKAELNKLLQLPTDQQTPEAADRLAALRQRLNVSNSQIVPDAPYKKSWPLLTFRRMLWQAAQDGSDWLAWNTGDQVVKHGTGKDIATAIYDNELPNIAKDEAKRLGLGKDQVKQLRVGPNARQQDLNLTDSQKRSLQTVLANEGPDILDGLDNIMSPSALNELNKRMNLSEQERGVFGGLRNNWLKAAKHALSGDDNDSNYDDYVDAAGELAEFMSRYAHKFNGTQHNAWGLRLTPEIRAKILKDGLPKFVGLGLAGETAKQYLQDEGLQ